MGGGGRDKAPTALYLRRRQRDAAPAVCPHPAPWARTAGAARYSRSRRFGPPRITRNARRLPSSGCRLPRAGASGSVPLGPRKPVWRVGLKASDPSPWPTAPRSSTLLLQRAGCPAAAMSPEPCPARRSPLRPLSPHAAQAPPLAPTNIPKSSFFGKKADSTSNKGYIA